MTSLTIWHNLMISDTQVSIMAAENGMANGSQIVKQSCHTILEQTCPY